MTNTENIWFQFNNELYGYINSKVKNKDIAKDILQDVFIKIHLKLDKLTEKDKLSSWVWQITRNSILDYFRSRKFTDELSEDIEIFEMKEPLVSDHDFVKCLKPMMNHLPEKYKEALIQTELGQISQKDFAAQLDISYSGVKSRVQRGRQKLYELFNECCKIKTDVYGNVVDYVENHNCTKCN